MTIIIIRYQKLTATERQQIKWITLGLLLLVFNFLLDFAIFEIYPLITDSYIFTNGTQALLWELGQDTFSHISQILFGFFLALAVFRYRLWDIDPILNHTLVYSGLTFFIIVSYIAIVTAFSLFFHSQTNTLPGLIATVITAILFQPLRDKLRLRVNRLLYGQRDDPTLVLTQLAHHLETAETSTILPTLAQTIADTLKIPHVAIWLPAYNGQTESVATYGDLTPSQTEMIPLVHQNKVIGRLMIAPREQGEQFNHQERQLLNTIAALTANVIRVIQLSDQFRQSRQRIVTAREDERRRLRRDLHDGLGPQLASQILGLEAVEQLLPTNPQKAYQLLAALKSQAQEAITDIRRLVYGLRPPTLDDLGLVRALQQSAVRYENANLRFIFDIPTPFPEMPAAVETAVYRIVQEAMTNTVRHAQATISTVHLSQANDQLRLEISDNGQGLPPNYHSGIGLQSIRERVAELNGRCMIESSPVGGTKIKAWFPLLVNERGL